VSEKVVNSTGLRMEITQASTDTYGSTFTYHSSLLSLRTPLKIGVEAVEVASDCNGFKRRNN